MYKKIIFTFLIANLLSSCISIAVDSESQTPVHPDFVTATLIPTKAGFVPATLTPIPAMTVSPTIAITAPPNCKDGAVLLRDVTIQDNTQVNAGEKFTKTWEFQNTGTCPWVNYTLKFSAGDQMNAPLSAPIPATVSNEKVQVSVELTAPASNGTYKGYFTLHNSDGEIILIGIEKTFWVKIIVGTGTAQATSASSSASTPYVPPGGNSNCAYTQNAGYVSAVISLINQARASANLPALAVNSQLMSAAQNHSADMACNNFLDHTGSDGSWIGDRLLRAGYSANTNYGEIIAIGTAQDAMSQWESDGLHWDAILDPSVTEVGVGYAYYSDSDFGGYFTVDFGSK